MTVAPIKASYPKPINQMVDDANDSIRLFVSRSAGQHGRRMKEGWETHEVIEISTQPAPLDPPGARSSIEFIGSEPGFFERIKRIFKG